MNTPTTPNNDSKNDSKIDSKINSKINSKSDYKIDCKIDSKRDINSINVYVRKINISENKLLNQNFVTIYKRYKYCL